MVIKAIETRYKGYRFRSRLEARWAVFFDSMGFDWEYEPEGFVLEDGTYYLPDFLVHTKTYNDSEFWVEVKPKELTIEEIKKCELLSKGTNKGVVLAIGVPDNIIYEEIWYNEETREFGKTGIEFEYRKFGIYINDGKYGCEPNLTCGVRIESILSARGVRFEHGEDTEGYVEMFAVRGDFRNFSQIAQWEATKIPLDICDNNDVCDCVNQNLCYYIGDLHKGSTLKLYVVCEKCRNSEKITDTHRIDKFKKRLIERLDCDVVRNLRECL